MLVINPDDCIDCGVCAPECPANAIVADNDLPEADAHFRQLNAELAQLWPVLSRGKRAPDDAGDWNGKPGKLRWLER